MARILAPGVSDAVAGVDLRAAASASAATLAASAASACSFICCSISRSSRRFFSRLSWPSRTEHGRSGAGWER